MTGTTDPDAAWAQVVEHLLEQPDLIEGRAFSSTGITRNGKIVAMLVRGELGLKLPAERCAELVGSRVASRFLRAGSRPMREWVAIDAAHSGDWIDLADEAAAFARAAATSS